MRHGKGTDLPGITDPEEEIGMIYVSLEDERKIIITAILVEERFKRKHVVLVLPSENRAFQSPDDFDYLKMLRRKIYAELIIVTPPSSDLADFARQRRFLVLSNQAALIYYFKTGSTKPPKKYQIFFCYAHEDENLLERLKVYLKALQRQKIISTWHDRNIGAGTEWEREIDKHLNTADVILLLVSPDFIASDYCYSVEVKRAMERHERGEARVIPVILRPIYWQQTPFGKLQALPKDAKPIMRSNGISLDEAFHEVAEGIRQAIEDLENLQ